MNQPNLTGWYAGLVIGAVAVFAVVVLVATVLGLARTLGAKARDVSLTLDRACRNTCAMTEVAAIIVDAHQISVLLADLRRNLDTIYPGRSR